MSDYKFIEVRVEDGIADLRLNRPPLNVLHIPMMEEFNRVLDSLNARSDFAAIVIRGAGKAFSAGVDVADHTAERTAGMIGLFHWIFRKLAATDALTIAAVGGAALGGGCELACFCDVVLASDRAKFGQPEVQVGVFPPVAACVLPLQVGLKKAIELTVLGATIDAAEGQRIGLVNQVYPSEQFETSVARFLEGITKLSRPVVRAAKRAIMVGIRESLLSHLDRAEEIYLGDLMKLRDAQEGIAAFLENRAPVWAHA